MKTPEQLRQYYRNYRAKNKERMSAYHAERYIKKKDDIAAQNKRWTAKNPHVVRAKTRMAQMRRAGLIPAWADLEWVEFATREAYCLAVQREQIIGGKWEVDHTIPINGKNVSGLHVPENLAVVPANLNRRKANKHEEAQ